jgi:hypothetical protein
MNYLQLCQKAHTLCGLQGTFSSVSTTTTYQQTLANFVAEAWTDIQNLRKDWPFMRSSVDISISQGVTEYALSTIFPVTDDMARWIGQGWWTDTDNTRKFIRWMGYAEYLYQNIDQSSQGPLQYVTQDPVDKHIYVNPPDGSYTLTLQYYTDNVVLANNDDEPLLPHTYHILIAYLGAAYMAAYLSNMSMYNLLQTKADSLMGSLMRTELPAQRINVQGIC